MMEYMRLDDATIKELKTIVGEGRVLHGDDDRLEAYSHDEAGSLYGAPPEAVVKPGTAEEVSRILSLAFDRRIPVTPRGAGSGLAGGAVPLFGGIVLSCERLNRILEIDTENMVAVAEAGVITNELCRAVDEVGLFYAGFPMSVESSYIGGNVACNAGGARVVKYGPTGAHVLGLELVLPSGELVVTGGKRRKDSSGYPLRSFFIGSEGTLAVFTKVILNLLPKPGAVADVLVPFRSIEKAIAAIPKAIHAARVLPAAVEFMDQPSVSYCSAYTNMTLPYQDRAGAYLILQFEGRTRDELQDTYEIAGDVCLGCGALEVYVADNRLVSDKIWTMRRNWLEALRAIDPLVGTGDFVVPSATVPAMMRKLEEIAAHYDTEIACVGHAADGNLHPAVLRRDDTPTAEWKLRMEEIVNRIAVEAADLGGAVSGEHGVGFLKKGILGETKTKEIAVMRQVKNALDPRAILNPGKLFS